jgi:hypothetical protein
MLGFRISPEVDAFLGRATNPDGIRRGGPEHDAEALRV